jgi:hypothetical protein
MFPGGGEGGGGDFPTGAETWRRKLKMAFAFALTLNPNPGKAKSRVTASYQVNFGVWNGV